MNCKDDDGKLLHTESHDNFQYLEVAHILPHSLTKISAGDAELVRNVKFMFKALLTCL